MPQTLSNQTVLGLDVGTSFGWTLDGQSAEHTLLPKDDTKYFLFMQYLNYFIHEKEVDVIVYEDARFQIGNAISIFHGLAGVLKAIAEENNVKVVALPVATVKKSFLGTGRPSKDDQAAAAVRLGWKKKANSKCMTLDRCNQLGYTYTNEDAADALSIWHTYNKSEV